MGQSNRDALINVSFRAPFPSLKAKSNIGDQGQIDTAKHILDRKQRHLGKRRQHQYRHRHSHSQSQHGQQHDVSTTRPSAETPYSNTPILKPRRIRHSAIVLPVEANYEYGRSSFGQRALISQTEAPYTAYRSRYIDILDMVTPTATPQKARYNEEVAVWNLTSKTGYAEDVADRNMSTIENPPTRKQDSHDGVKKNSKSIAAIRRQIGIAPAYQLFPGTKQSNAPSKERAFVDAMISPEPAELASGDENPAMEISKATEKVNDNGPISPKPQRSFNASNIEASANSFHHGPNAVSLGKSRASDPNIEKFLAASREHPVDTHIETATAPAVTHETMNQEITELRQEVISRDIHKHEYRTMYLPVIDLKVLQPKHFVQDASGHQTEINPADLSTSVDDEQIRADIHDEVMQQMKQKLMPHPLRHKSNRISLTGTQTHSLSPLAEIDSETAASTPAVACEDSIVDEMAALSMKGNNSSQNRSHSSPPQRQSWHPSAPIGIVQIDDFPHDLVVPQMPSRRPGEYRHLSPNHSRDFSSSSATSSLRRYPPASPTTSTVRTSIESIDSVYPGCGPGTSPPVPSRHPLHRFSDSSASSSSSESGSVKSSTRNPSSSPRTPKPLPQFGFPPRHSPSPASPPIIPLRTASRTMSLTSQSRVKSPGPKNSILKRSTLSVDTGRAQSVPPPSFQFDIPPLPMELLSGVGFGPEMGQISTSDGDAHDDEDVLDGVDIPRQKTATPSGSQRREKRKSRSGVRFAAST